MRRGACGPPLSYGTRAPAYWRDDLASQPGNLLTADQCVIANEHFFVRARIVLPIVDSPETFEWSVWVSLSPGNYQRACDLWNDPARVNEPPYFGWPVMVRVLVDHGPRDDEGHIADDRNRPVQERCF
ncbi:DUF2199 domain-containing protein [Amycolatopsis rhizosphaerae]|uniref:DUF2199 domain-containing protein n=1 Tax=Amycolatopsis rhizosphaerae TaxID=2053003 RepID=UPI001643AF60|nr:DUF2199 domain-containing protein [Amycolatopsis rhizosphaerae]